VFIRQIAIKTLSNQTCNWQSDENGTSLSILGYLENSRLHHLLAPRRTGELLELVDPESLPADCACRFLYSAGVSPCKPSRQMPRRAVLAIDSARRNASLPHGPYSGRACSYVVAHPAVSISRARLFPDDILAGRNLGGTTTLATIRLYWSRCDN